MTSREAMSSPFAVFTTDVGQHPHTSESRVSSLTGFPSALMTVRIIDTGSSSPCSAWSHIRESLAVAAHDHRGQAVLDRRMILVRHHLVCSRSSHHAMPTRRQIRRRCPQRKPAVRSSARAGPRRPVRYFRHLGWMAEKMAMRGHRTRFRPGGPMTNGVAKRIGAVFRRFNPAQQGTAILSHRPVRLEAS